MLSSKSKSRAQAPITSVTTGDIKVTLTPIHVIDRLKEASGLVKPFNPPADTITCVQYNPSFSSIIGPSPTHSLLVSSAHPHFHEACVYTPSTNTSLAELWITSNVLYAATGQILISKLKLARSADHEEASHHEETVTGGSAPVTSTTWTKMRPPQGVHMPNGAVNAPFTPALSPSLTSSPPAQASSHSNGILICAQGSNCQPTSPGTPGGIYHMSSSGTRPMITNYLGRAFNSPNDVVVHSDGSIWFTDPQYGFDQGFKSKPELPNQTYRFDPQTGDCRVVADGLGRPNGICFNSEETVCYITDTDTSQGGELDDPKRAATIYVYDVTYPASPSSQTEGAPSYYPPSSTSRDKAPAYPGVERADTMPPSYDDSTSQTSAPEAADMTHPTPCSDRPPYLTNKRVFTYVSPGFPDGIKCDTLGNVYSGCGDGVHVWDRSGTFLGKIATGSWVANFCFGEMGELFICNETKVWRVQLNSLIRGALLGL